jgi:hypothetical protein
VRGMFVLAMVASVSMVPALPGCGGGDGDPIADAGRMDGGRADGAMSSVDASVDLDGDTLSDGAPGSADGALVFDAFFPDYLLDGAVSDGAIRDGSSRLFDGDIYDAQGLDADLTGDADIVDGGDRRRDGEADDGGLMLRLDGFFPEIEGGLPIGPCIPECEAPMFCCPRTGICVLDREECEMFPLPGVE